MLVGVRGCSLEQCGDIVSKPDLLWRKPVVQRNDRCLAITRLSSPSTLSISNPTLALVYIDMGVVALMAGSRFARGISRR